MFERIIKLFRKTEKKGTDNPNSKETAKERLHLVLMQDRANVSADFLDLMREEIIEVIKKYIDIDEKAMDVRLTNQSNDDGSQGAPALYANIPILNIKDESRNIKKEKEKGENPIKEEKELPKEEEKKIVEAQKIVKEELKAEAIVEENKEEQLKQEETQVDSTEFTKKDNE